MLKRNRVINQIPGTINYTGTRAENTPVSYQLIQYDSNEMKEEQPETFLQIQPFKNKVTWLNVNGIQNANILEKIGEKFQLHPLTLEDIANVQQRAKVEVYPNYLFFVFKMLQLDEDYNLDSEQFSFVLTKDTLLSFQEKEGDIFDPLRQRLRTASGRIRQKGSDYLAFSLMDAIVDNYFVILEQLNETMETLEDKTITDPDQETLQQIHKLKRIIISMRKSIWPLRDTLSRLYKDADEYFSESTLPYLRDLYDHSLQLIDSVETYRDILNGFLDIYMSTINNKTNEVMKVLTIIATIFIPLTFIAGVYGMNFEFMPELKLPWGYFAVLGVMALVAVIMLVFFKKKKWL